MKTGVKKTSTTTATTILRAANQPFFAKAGGGSFFAPATRTATSTVQMKMAVNKPGDEFEQEADTMADRVMQATTSLSTLRSGQLQRQEMPEDEVQRQEEEELQRKEVVEDEVQRQGEEEIRRQEMPEDEVRRQVAPEEEVQRQQDEELQRQATPEEEVQRQDEEGLRRQAVPEEEEIQRQGNGAPTVHTDTQTTIHHTMTGGRPLSADVRSHMEPRFGADFSTIRIHSDAEAARLSSQLSARAFTYRDHIFFSRDQYQPGTSEGKKLLAHELTHTIQQGHAAQRSPRITTTATPPLVQRLGIQDALDYFADKAYHIPGFRLLTIVLGVNPINMRSTDRSAANILRALIELVPGGHLITQALERHGVFNRAGAWVEQQLAILGDIGGDIARSLRRFLDSLSWTDIFDLGGVWERGKRIFTNPIRRLISFADSAVRGIMQLVKDAVLRPLASMAEGTRGYPLLKAILGRDPITGDPVPRNAETLIGGFMQLIGREEVWQNIQRGNAVARAWAWFQGALAGLMGFVRAIPGQVVAIFRSLTWQDVISVVGVFAKVGRAFLNIAGRFISWGGRQVMSLLEIIFAVVAPGVMPYLRRVRGAFRSIIQNPIGFVRNLVRAGIQGFRQFATNILTHLRASLIGWLTGAMSGANIYIPQALNLREILKFVLSVLGLTWQNIRQKLVRAIGERAVSAMETGFELVRTLVTEGPAAAWQQILEGISNLREMVMEQIMSFVQRRVVQAAITRLLTSLNPAGAFIQAIIAIYNTIMFFVERLRQISQVAMAFINSMMAIASGNIRAAANRVERTMAGLLTLVISFLARIAGLGNVAQAVTNIIDRVRRPIDRALDRVVAWIVRQARRLGRFVAQAGVPQDPNERLRLGMQVAVRAVNRYAGRRIGQAILTPVLLGIKTRYGFTRLEIFDKSGKWAVRGTINPTDEKDTDAQADQGQTASAGPRNVSQQIVYSEVTLGNRRHKIARGNLGVPGVTATHRSTSSQRTISRGTGDDAGHLIGNIFGGSGGVENLSPQNWIQNRFGTFRRLERQWANQFQNGAQIYAKVTDVYKLDESRPFMRNVKWEVKISGQPTIYESLDFANPHTPKSRSKRDIEPTVPEPQSGNIIYVDFQNRRRV